MTVKKILCICGAIFFLGLSIKALNSSPEAIMRLEEAVYLEQPVIDPANEGKLVVIFGKPETTDAVYDEEYDIAIWAPYVSRDSRVYREKEYNGKWEHEWKMLQTQYFLGSAILGEFTLADSTLTHLPLNESLGLDDYDEGVLSSYYQYEENGLAVLSERELDYTKFGGLYNSIGLNGDGQTMFSYKCFDPDTHEAVTIVGIQSGNTLVVDDTIDAHPVWDGILDQEALLAAQSSDNRVGFLFPGVISLIFLFFGLKGVLFMRHSQKKA